MIADWEKADGTRRADRTESRCAPGGARARRHERTWFGSVVRGTAGPQSDVEFLVEMEPGRTLLDLMALIREFGALLGRKADVTTPAALHPLLASRILAEARPL
jgi:predicted nucleotidyltransferase